MSYEGNAQDGKHYWLTPKDVYDKLDQEFKFNFDPSSSKGIMIKCWFCSERLIKRDLQKWYNKNRTDAKKVCFRCWFLADK